MVPQHQGGDGDEVEGGGARRRGPEAEPDGARLPVRFPSKEAKEHIRQVAARRKMSANELILATLRREFPMSEAARVEDLERAIRDFESGEAPREEILGRVMALKGTPWYLSGAVVTFLGDLSVDRPDRLHVQALLLRHAFREGSSDHTFTTESRRGSRESAATILLHDLDRSGILTAPSVSDGDRVTALSAIMSARRATGALLPGVIDCLIRCVEGWKGESLLPLEDAFRSPLLRADWEALLARLRTLPGKQTRGETAEALRTRARRMIQVLRTCAPAAAC